MMRRGPAGGAAAHKLPTDPTTARLVEVLKPGARSKLITAVGRTGDLELAATRVARSLMGRGTMGQARTFAQVLQQTPGTAVAGDVCRALIALRDGEPETAWALLATHDPRRVLALAPTEMFRAGLLVAPQQAAALFDRVRAGDLEVAIGPRAWRDIAGMTFAAGLEGASVWALDRAVDLADDGSPIAEDAAWLRRWYGRRDRRSATAATDAPSFAILDADHPQRSAAPGEEQDSGQRSVLDAVTRHHGIDLYRVGRDATSYADVPNGTWLVVTGRLPQPLFGIRTDLPYDERYRPVFASIRIPNTAALTAEVIDQLRRCGPVGCATWGTYYLLRGLQVPAFRVEDLPNAVDLIVDSIVATPDPDEVYLAWQDHCRSAVTASEALDEGEAGHQLFSGSRTTRRSTTRPSAVARAISSTSSDFTRP